jgi:tRNA-dihydrouridine synthase A
MMECTDRHFRFLARLISRHVRLYTEMVTAPAIVHGRKEFLLAYSPAEHPVALQLGGSNPDELERCAALGAQYGYDEINLNVGCPSDRVQSGRFGACLMAEPELVRDCVKAMIRGTGGAGSDVPVTVKHRIGIDDKDSYEELKRFVATVAEGGCTLFAVHARKAWLKGLSPKENREKPPLRYEIVQRLAADFPELQFVINGGIVSLAQAEPWFHELHGVMIGREAYRDPMMLAGIDQRFHGATEPPPTTEEVVRAYIPYVRERVAEGERLHFIVRHLHGLFLGAKGAKAWRTALAEGSAKANGNADAGAEVIERALDTMLRQPSAKSGQ